MGTRTSVWTVVVALIVLPWASAHGDDAAAGEPAALWARAIATREAGDVEATTALVALGENAVPVLVEGLGAPEGWQRSRAAEVLEQLGPRGAAASDALTDALFDRSWIVRRQAVYALGAMGEAGRSAWPAIRRAVAAPPLLEQYPSDGPSEREAAAWVLLLVDGHSATTAREVLLRPPTSRVLYAYLEKDPVRLREVLPALLTNSSWRVRSAAVWVLRYMVPKLDARDEWLQRLGTLAGRDAVPAVRLSAARVLNRLVAQSHLSVDPSLLTAVLGDDAPSVRAVAADTLAFLTPQGKEFVDALRKALRDADPSVRQGAALALGRTKDLSLRPALEPLLRDGDMAPAAAVALVNLGARDADLLSAIAATALQERNSRPKPATLYLRAGRGLRAMAGKVDLGARAEGVLLALGADAVPGITPHASHGSILVRERAHQMLARLGPRGIEQVRRLLRGDNLEHAREAAAALVEAHVRSDDAIRILLDAAVDDESEGLGSDAEEPVISEDYDDGGIDWRETVVPLLIRADPTVTHAVLNHARARLGTVRGLEPDTQALLVVHEEVLRGLGEKARPFLDDALEDDLLRVWVQRLLAAMQRKQ